MNNYSDTLDDRAIRSTEEDKLDRSSFVQGLVRALVRDEISAEGKLVARRSSGHVLGLTGPWGSGKSSVLSLLALKLGSMDRVAVVSLNPWLFKGRDELLAGFFSALRYQLGRTGKERFQGTLEALEKYQDAIFIPAQVAAAVADIKGAGGTATRSFSAIRQRISSFLKRHSSVSADEQRKELEKKLSATNCAVVVLIDELDRVEDEDVRAVAQLVKAVGDIRGISYVVAYDPERVVDALGRGTGAERQRTGALYLEKIVQHPVPLRPLFEDDVHSLLKEYVEARSNGQSLPNNDEVYETLVHVIKTPREIKRLIGAFSVLNEMTQGELNSSDLLGYSWIITKSPHLKKAIVDAFSELIVDPASADAWMTHVFRERRQEKRTPVSVLGDEAAQHDRLLKLLFPTLDGDGHRDAAGDRICRRRNLTRLLYLGDPPGSFTGKQVLEVARLAPDNLTAKLKGLLASGHLAAFLDRTDDALNELSSDHFSDLFVALSAALERDHDWLDGQEPQRGLADDAQQVLLNFSLRGPAEARTAKTALNALRDSGDLTILPGYLRSHLFNHGLTEDGSPRGGQTTLTKDDTEALLASEAARYRHAILSGMALRRITDVEAFFVLKNANLWDSHLHQGLTDQLVIPEAIETFAGMFIPPGFVVEKRTLDEMIDTEAVLTRLLEFQSSGEFRDEPWIRASVKRLRRVLQGKDPHFDRYDDD